MRDDQFTAIGPSNTGSGFSRAAFSDIDMDPKSPQAFSYGVNVQGASCGVYGQSLTDDGTTPRLSPENAGVCGVGQNLGVIGVGSPLAKAGVYGHGQGGVTGSGVVGAMTPSGLPTSVAKLHGEQKAVGVYGTDRRTPTMNQVIEIGVHGDSETGDGVYGQSDRGVGVLGISGASPRPKDDRVPGAGVVGVGPTAGVIGFAESGGRDGVRGLGTIGSIGVSTNRVEGYGVMGRASIPAAELSKDPLAFNMVPLRIGVLGAIGSQDFTKNNTSNVDNSSVGVFGSAALVGDPREPSVGPTGFLGWAGVFYGPVYIAGPLLSPIPKSAVVQHPDGSHRTLYCVESPDCWFEDFGEGKLKRGRCEITLDPDFVALIKTKTMHIFLSAYGDSTGIYVCNRHDRGFEVREHGNGKSSLTFSYRVVAKRKDVSPRRLAKVSVPPGPTIAAKKTRAK